jgi:tellurite resistance protein
VEILIGILVLVVWAFLGQILSAAGRTVKAVGKTALGDGSLAVNMQREFARMGAFQINVVTQELGDDGKTFTAKAIEGRGLFPVSRKTNVGFVTSVFDETDSELLPVVSAIEAFQEKESAVFQHVIEIGPVEPNQGFFRWVRVGGVIPEILVPPKGGIRKLKIVVRMVDLDNMPLIKLGFSDPNSGHVLWAGAESFEYNCTEKGYEEAAEHREEALTLAAKIGVAVAMADGSLATAEGTVIKNWVIKSVSPFSSAKQTELKSRINAGLREAYGEARNANLSLSVLTARLNEIGEKSQKYEAIELAFDVMAADGIVDRKEMRMIQKVAEALGLDYAELEKLRDKRIVGLNIKLSKQATVEEIIGIEAGWSHEQIKRHLRTEYQKWNNRINALPEGDERDNAQHMLEVIAEARKKYA